MAATNYDIMGKIQYLLMFGGLGMGFLEILNPILQACALLITISLGALKFYDRFFK